LKKYVPIGVKHKVHWKLNASQLVKKNDA